MKQLDRRISRTQFAIHEALFSLLEQRSIDKITVQDITQLANINRSTFYLHYSDIYNLIEKVENDILEKMNEIGRQTRNQIDKKMDASILSQGMTHVYTHIQNNARQFKLLLGSNGSPSLQTKIIKQMKLNIHMLVSEMIPNQQEHSQNEYLLAFLASANLGLITHWISSDMRKTPSELAQMMSTLIIGGVAAYYANETV